MAAGSVYVVNELVGTSTESWEEATRNAIATTGAKLRDLRIGEVVRKDVTIEDGTISQYRVRLSISFRYET